MKNRNKLKKLTRPLVPGLLQVVQKYDYETRLRIYDRLRIETEKKVEELTMQQKEIAREMHAKIFAELRHEMDDTRQELIASGTDVRLIAKYVTLNKKMSAMMSDPQAIGYFEDTEREREKNAKE